jgi:hypothetical protein
MQTILDLIRIILAIPAMIREEISREEEAQHEGEIRR